MPATRTRKTKPRRETGIVLGDLITAVRANPFAVALLWVVKGIFVVSVSIGGWILASAKEVAIKTLETAEATSEKVDEQGRRLTTIESKVEDAASAAQVEELSDKMGAMDTRLTGTDTVLETKQDALQVRVEDHETRLKVVENDNARRNQEWTATYVPYLQRQIKHLEGKAAEEEAERAKKP